MNVSGAAATSGAAFAAVVNGGQAQKQVKAAAAGEVRAAEMAQDISKMAGTLIDKTLEQMSEMQATMGVDVLV